MSDHPSEEELRAMVALSELYWEDVGSGRVRSLIEYLELFPGHEAIIAAEYLELVRLGKEEAPETDRDGETGARNDFGPYRLEEEIGRGGQGTVWRARDSRLDRLVALKVLNAVGPKSETRIRRFRREANVVSGLNHPGICAVFEAGLEDGVPFIAMELVDGETLAARITRIAEASSHPTEEDIPSTSASSTGAPAHGSRFEDRSRSAATIAAVDTPQTLRLFETVARALHFAHEAGVIHRDLKPGNLIVRSDGEPVILDFGLARSEDEGQESLTGTTDVLGTPAYMPPEQIQGAPRRLDRRCDVYSLGITLWECLTLRRPFEAATRELLYERILRQPAPDPSRQNPEISSALRTVLTTAIDRDPERRYATALDLAEDLRRVREHRPIQARPIPALVRLGFWIRRNRGAAIGLCVAVISLTAGLVASLFFLGEAREDSATALRALHEYEQMSAASLVRSLREEEAKLWPRRPGMIGAFDTWLTQADEAMSGLEAHRTARDRLRSAEAPLAPHLVEKDRQTCRESHPQLAAKVVELRKSLDEARSRRKRIIEKRSKAEKRLERSPSPQLRQRCADLEERELDESEEIERLEERYEVAAADPRLNLRLTLGSDDRRLEWRHEVLTRLVIDLEALQPLIAEVKARRECAEGLERRTVDDEAEAWARCLADLRIHPSYGGNQSLVDLGYHSRFTNAKPLLGLVPLGKDDRSGFWEFWVEESGPQPPWRSTGPDTGRVDLGRKLAAKDIGIVLVLLPGGRFTMGSSPAQRPNNAEEHPPHEVTLAPFFMSKYELTRGQWLRVFRQDPSQYVLGSSTGKPRKDLPIALRHPVTNVSSTSAQLLADRLAMILPTEAQWEYAARGGKTTPWHTGADSVAFVAARAGNVADRRLALALSSRRIPNHDDGFALSSPVGWFPPNPFGLHDMIGNLMEWTSQRLVQYKVPPEGEDGARPSTLPLVICRGGAFTTGMDRARASNRSVFNADYQSHNTGIRLARRWPASE